jgi:hypothetical protein
MVLGVELSGPIFLLAQDRSYCPDTSWSSSAPCVVDTSWRRTCLYSDICSVDTTMCSSGPVCRPFLSAVGDSAKHTLTLLVIFLAVSATAFKFFNRCLLQRLTFFSNGGDSAKKYKMAIIKPNPLTVRNFCPSS